MPEQLLTIMDIAAALKVGRTKAYEALPKLKKNGLQQVPTSMRSPRFRQETLDKAIKRAAERSEPLF